MTDARLTALSPLDGRYAHHLGELADYFSEAALIFEAMDYDFSRPDTFDADLLVRDIPLN